MHYDTQTHTAKSLPHSCCREPFTSKLAPAISSPRGQCQPRCGPLLLWTPASPQYRPTRYTPHVHVCLLPPHHLLVPLHPLSPFFPPAFPSLPPTFPLSFPPQVHDLQRQQQTHPVGTASSSSFLSRPQTSTGAAVLTVFDPYPASDSSLSSSDMRLDTHSSSTAVGEAVNLTQPLLTSLDN